MHPILEHRNFVRGPHFNLDQQSLEKSSEEPLPYSVKFSMVKIFNDFEDFCLAMKIYTQKFWSFKDAS